MLGCHGDGHCSSDVRGVRQLRWDSQDLGKSGHSQGSDTANTQPDGSLRRHVSTLSMHGRLTESAVCRHCSSITRFIPNSLVARPNLSEWSAKVTLTMDPANIGPSCTPANYRGFNCIFSHGRRLTRTVLLGHGNAEPYLAKVYRHPAGSTWLHASGYGERRTGLVCLTKRSETTWHPLGASLYKRSGSPAA